MNAGDTLGPFRLVRPLGEGGMGQVFEATREGHLEPVALKVLHPLRDEAAGAFRLLDEAKLGAWIRHPNVVRVLESGVEGRRPYLSMELLRGRPLSRLGLTAGVGMPAEAVVGIGLQALAGLAAAHAARDGEGRPLGVVHRDIKPSNLFLGDDGVVKLIDFGIARASSLDQTESRTGTIRGSVAYSSPEQVRGDALDVRTDLFSLGLVLHELLTGRRVHAMETDAAVITAILFSPIPPARGLAPLTPAALEATLSRALEKASAARFATAEAFAGALEASLGAETPWSEAQLATWLQSRPRDDVAVRPKTATWHRQAAAVEPVRPPRRRRWPRYAAASVLVLGGLSTFLAMRPHAVPVPVAVPVAVAVPASKVEPPPQPKPEPVLSDTTPATVTPLPPRRPHRPHRASVTPLASEPAYLTIDAKPSYGHVFLDGHDMGLTPAYRLPTRAGRHLVEVRTEDGRRQRQTVTLDAQEVRKLVFQW